MIRGLSCAFALSVSAMMLSGCVTAAKDTAEAASADAVVPVVASADAAQAAPGSYQDQQVSAAGANAQQQPGAQANAMMPAPNNGQPSSLTMQSTGLNATSNSIFAVQTPNAAPVHDAAAAAGNAPLPAGQATGVNPATNSLFNSGQPAPNQPPLPLEGASNADGSAATQQVASAQIGADGTPLPVAVPIPTSSVSMRGGRLPQSAAVQTASTEGLNSTPAAIADSKNSQNSEDTPDEAEKPLTLAALFAAKRKNRSQFSNDRFAKAPEKKTIVASDLKSSQTAALGFTALPGVRTTSMYATVDDSQPGHDDDSPAVEMASLSGLARLAPNGLVLQTEKVETGCFQPDLLQVLKVIETHYGRKIMVTSGLRDLKHNASAGGRKHSLHTTCEAADIQVPGVSKWELADYLRTIPGRGGVGTYCHTESVHIDTGESRDWNWRCRRRKG
ncbi:YcbK family protein [Pararhizobium sp.]|uniref:YcbK family protein n=1 Tax=Pararhizobium sp. TaxID=1977563 RepID=UPI003D148FA6